MISSSQDSQQARTAGKWGEDAAYNFYAEQGYAVLERNWRLGHLEIDIIAQKGELVAFVEVKTRLSQDADPISAVDKRKRSRMILAADAFLKRFDLPFEYRFDIINITGTPESHVLEHIPDAFFPPLKRIR